MKSFEIRLVNKHLLFNYNGKTVLVDTGAPVTFCRGEKNLEFLGRIYKCNLSGMEMMAQVMGMPMLPGMDRMMERMPDMPGMPGRNPMKYIDNASDFVGERIDVMMGTNILQDFNVVIDYSGRKISFFEKGERVNFGGTHQLPMKKAMDGHIGLVGEIDGKKVTLAVDSGAKIQYIGRKHTDGKQSVRTETDFHESTGRFETGIYPLEVKLAGQVLPMEFGNLPRMLQMMLRMSGFDGVVGWDFFSGRKVLLDFQGGRICWE